MATSLTIDKPVEACCDNEANGRSGIKSANGSKRKAKRHGQKYQVSRERPILFSGEMILRILAGEKTQTRRVVKPQPDGAFEGPGVYQPTVVGRDGEEREGEPVCGIYSPDGEWGIKCPYGKPGDRLWVRETFDAPPGSTNPNDVVYRADYTASEPQHTWKPSIFLPRWASRITLEITDIRVERLQEISEVDAQAEGAQGSMMPELYTVVFEGGGTVEIGANYVHGIPKAGDVLAERRVAHVEHNPAHQIATPLDEFRSIWNRINTKPGICWDDSPWVWAITFKRVTPAAFSPCLKRAPNSR